MRKSLSTLAVVAAATIATATPAQAATLDPAARIKVGSGVTLTGETVVRVVLDNTDSTAKVTGEVVRVNTLTGRMAGSQYVTVRAGRTAVKRYEQTEGNTFRYIVRYYDAVAARRTVTSNQPTKPYARIAGTECAGVGTLVTFAYGNPTGSAKTFVTHAHLGDGSGEIVKRTKVPAHSMGSASVQIGNAPADTYSHLASGRDLGGEFAQPAC